MNTTDKRPPRMQIVWDVLECAKDADDEMMVAACRRLINADRIGKRSPADYQLVLAFTA